MSEDNAVAPNWLKELEEKRERRTKARIGHETGAGAPCVNCKENCPGLDLHFWRKICKICKCAKEEHDVPDDDIYGWAQFQLLGSKPNKSRKIKLAGKQNEVELEWTPGGHNETVDKFLQTLPPELLPVKGSPAALERKQLLQRQIPVHDVDPSLCHELTAPELEQMNEYIAHVKQYSVGVGRLVQLGPAGKGGDWHVVGGGEAHYLASRLQPARLSDLQAVKLQAADKAKALAKKMQQALEVSGDDFSPNGNSPVNFNEPKTNEPQAPQLHGTVESIEEKGPGEGEETGRLISGKPLPNYASGKYNLIREDRRQPKYGNIKDLAFSTYQNRELQGVGVAGDSDLNCNKINLPELKPEASKFPENFVQNPQEVKIGAISDLSYPVAESDGEMEDPGDILRPPPAAATTQQPQLQQRCHHCRKPFESDAIVIGIDRSDAHFHADCFRCAGCNQNLADLLYFYDRSSDKIYCGRDYAKIRGIPRCSACDELIFVKEYCLAENSTFHVKHFCCFRCDCPLAGQNYLMEDAQPLCIPCYNASRAQRCAACREVIKPDETGVVLKDIHFHADDSCFSCRVCRLPLLKSKFLLRDGGLFCSGACFARAQSE